MMMRQRFRVGLLTTCLLALAASGVCADSPITSTTFSDAYLDYPAVRAARASGVMTAQLVEYLKSSAPLDVKAAVINALSWRYEGKQNADIYCRMRYRQGPDELQLDRLGGDELLVLGYLLVMDDYFKPERALPPLELAVRKLPESFTAAMILALVRCQVGFGGDWADMWPRIQRVLDEESLNGDMRLGAVRIITDYMRLYEGD